MNLRLKQQTTIKAEWFVSFFNIDIGISFFWVMTIEVFVCDFTKRNDRRRSKYKTTKTLSLIAFKVIRLLVKMIHSLMNFYEKYLFSLKINRKLKQNS